MRIRWTLAAADDLQQVHDYLSEHEPHLARSTVIAIRESIHSMRKFPKRGRPGAVEGTRELLHGRLPYIVAYRVEGDAVEILHIWHTSQDRP
ncbi:MAG TPA: type II toxin-antitoxin system RelE/ParE family toxin [Candidatus Dormibacteraeota bacterium]|nr:type II toxin-antitoxin system RelE/ParE family toxin [Candidatus Dormibacteraeota bacterium]